MFVARGLWLLAFGALGCSSGDEFEGDCNCDAATELCQETGTDVAGEPGTRACVALPASCEAPTCDCLAGQSDGFDFCLELGSCTDGGDEQVMVLFCPGG